MLAGDELMLESKLSEEMSQEVNFNKRHEECQYLDQLRMILETGRRKDDETGTEPLTVFGMQARYSLRNGVFPLLTTKRVSFRDVAEELLWSIRGSTNSEELRQKKVDIWNKYGSRTYLDKLGFHDRKEGDLGPMRGFQWRHYGAEYKDFNADYTGQGCDQLASVIHLIRTNPNDRRMILNAWNPVDLPKMALPPCDILAQFIVADGGLSCQLYQSPADMGLGVPFTIASYALLTCMIAHVTGLEPHEFIHSCNHAHIYLDHIGALKQQLTRRPKPFPNLVFKRAVTDIDDFKLEDFEICGYEPHPTIKMDIEEILVRKELVQDLNASALNGNNRHDECQYLNQLRMILENGCRKDDRTGTGTLSVFGTQARYSLRNGVFPLLTTKRVFFRGVAEELLWFIRGSTNSEELRQKKVDIWNENSSRAYLDKLGFHDRKEGDLGPVYGFQWRHYGAEYRDFNADYTGQGCDQLANVIHLIRTNPNNRRIIMNAWNPVDLPKMALPPCHILAEFTVVDGGLSCHLYQRSADMGLGVPFNIASYALLTCMIAHVTGLEPHEFIHTCGDTHIYLNHVGALKQQLTRRPKPFPKLVFRRAVTDIDDLKMEDFEICGYEPHPTIKMDMAV